MKFIKSLIIAYLFLSNISYSQVSVFGKVDHLTPDGIDTVGNILLNVSGSTSPYTYTWTPGAINTKDITNVGLGQYTVNVLSASSQTYTGIYKLGYKTIWTNRYNATFRNDSLFNTSGSTTINNSAVSKNTLSVNTDGWFEYVFSVVSPSHHYIGFADSLSPILSYSDIDYGIYHNGTGHDLYSIQTGASNVLIKSDVKVGDVIRLERTGNVIKYVINNVAVRTVTVTGVSTKVFKLSAYFSGTNKFINTGCSFMNLDNQSIPNYVKVKPYITHNTGYSTSDGFIKVLPKIVYTNTYSWTPGGIATNTISSLATGIYKCNIKDSINNESNHYYNIGYKTFWTNFHSCIFRNDSIISTAIANLSSSTVSKNVLRSNENGWVDHVFNTVSTDSYHIGLLDSLSPLKGTTTDIDFGYYYYGVGHDIYYYEGGTIGVLYTNVLSGDILRIERVSNTIYYKINGATLRTVTVSGLGSKVLKIKVAVQNDERLANIGCSFYNTDSTNFKNYVLVTPTIKHSSGGGINNGSITLSGNHSYSWEVSEQRTNKISNLNNGVYKVIVKDTTLQNTSPYEYNIGYKTDWTNLQSCFFRNDTLKGTGNSYTVPVYAYSKNVLPASIDGYFEYVLKVVPVSGEIAHIGLVDTSSHSLATITEFKYSFYLDGGNKYLYTYEGALNGVLYASPKAGDVLRIERAGNTIKYLVNGILLRSVTSSTIGSSVYKLKVKTVHNYEFVNVGCSFSNKLGIETSSVTNYENDTIQGKVNLTRISGGTAPYQIAWQGVKMPSAVKAYHDLITKMPALTIDSVEFKNFIDTVRYKKNYSSLLPGLYPFKIYDKLNDSASIVATIGTKINWVLSKGLSIETKTISPRYLNGTTYIYGTGEKLTQTGTYTLGGSVALASNFIKEDHNNFIEFTYPNSNYACYAGLQKDTANISELSYKTYFEFDGLGVVKVHFLDSVIYTGTPLSDDVYTISNDTSTGNITFYRNSSALVSRQFSRLDPESGLLFKAVMTSVGSKLGGVIIGTSPIHLTNKVTAVINDASCANSCSGSIDAKGITALISNPVKYELYNATNPTVVIQTITYSSGINHALFQDLCAGKYIVKYYANLTPHFWLGGSSTPVLISFSSQFEIGYRPDWIQVTNCNITIPNNTLTKNAGTTGVEDAGANTENILAGTTSNAWLEWSPSATNCDNEFGISEQSNSFNTSTNSIHYGIKSMTFPGTPLPFNLYFATVNGVVHPSSYALSINSHVKDKLKIEKNGATLSFKYNNTNLGTPLTISNLNYVGDASVITMNDAINKPRLSFGCNDGNQFAVFKSKLDGGYYNLEGNVLLFKYFGAYNSSTLSYKVYDKGNNIIFSNSGTPLSISPSTNVVAGDNRYSINFNSVTLNTGYYVMELTNEKQEKLYLRFKK